MKIYHTQHGEQVRYEHKRKRQPLLTCGSAAAILLALAVLVGVLIEVL